MEERQLPSISSMKFLQPSKTRDLSANAANWGIGLDSLYSEDEVISTLNMENKRRGFGNKTTTNATGKSMRVTDFMTKPFMDQNYWENVGWKSVRDHDLVGTEESRFQQFISCVQRGYYAIDTVPKRDNNIALRLHVYLLELFVRIDLILVPAVYSTKDWCRRFAVFERISVTVELNPSRPEGFRASYFALHAKVKPGRSSDGLQRRKSSPPCVP